MKQKSNRALLKKIKVTGSGKIKVRATGQNHYNVRATGAQNRNKRKDNSVYPKVEKNIQDAISI